jgi:hypothetical protein
MVYFVVMYVLYSHHCGMLYQENHPAPVQQLYNAYLALKSFGSRYACKYIPMYIHWHVHLLSFLDIQLSSSPTTLYVPRTFKLTCAS